MIEAHHSPMGVEVELLATLRALCIRSLDSDMNVAEGSRVPVRDIGEQTDKLEL